MRISWVMSDQVVLDPTINLDQIKNIGSIWGGWQTWRQCQTDNVVCHNMKKAVELLDRNFTSICNFYIPKAHYEQLDNPPGVKLYEGTFPGNIESEDEIVSLHLAASVSDIVLLMGFDWSEKETNPDRLQEHRAHVYRTLVNGVIRNNPEVQFVAVEHPGEFRKDLKQFTNLTQDTLTTALSLLDS